MTASTLDTTFLLVSGTMRSGTTLLGELLYSREPAAQRHPQLSFDNDRVLTMRNLSRQLRRANWRAAIPGEDPFIPIPLSRSVIARYCGVSSQPLTEALALGRLGERLREEILSFAPSAESPLVIGLKSTHLFTEVDLLRRLFPRVLMVVMVRDPRDVLASSYGRLGGQLSPLLINRILLTTLAYHYFLLARSADPDILAVRYEDLARDPASELRRLLAATGLDPGRYDWASLTQGRVSSNSSWNRGHGVEMIADTGISTASIGSYQRRLTAFQTYAVEFLLAPMMARFGYSRAASSSPEFYERCSRELLPELYQDAYDHGVSVGPLETRLRELGLEALLENLPRSRWRPSAVARRAAALGKGLILAGRKKLRFSHR